MDQLGINWQGLLAQLVNFGLLLLLLRAVAYKPILKMLDERSERVRESLARAEQVKLQSAQADEALAARLAEARRQGQEIVARANQLAERIHQEAEQRAKRDSEDFLIRARAEIERDRERVSSELRTQVADLAVLIANRVVGVSLDEGEHRRLVQEALVETEQANLN